MTFEVRYVGSRRERLPVAGRPDDAVRAEVLLVTPSYRRSSTWPPLPGDSNVRR